MTTKNAEYRPSAPGIQAQESTITAQRTVLKAGKQVSEEDEHATIDVQHFVTAPASVMAKLGQTINLGDYESLRIDVAVTLPCYKEEVDEALDRASSIAGTFVRKEVAQVEAHLKSKRKS